MHPPETHLPGRATLPSRRLLHIIRLAAVVAALAISLLAQAWPRLFPPATQLARRLVRDYAVAVTTAYRTGDARCADGVVAPGEARRIASLIGLRADLGLVLDAELLALRVLGAERDGPRLRVRTEERWRYCQRRTETRQPVGGESVDRYLMVYEFRKLGARWRAEQTRFAAAPDVGQTQTPWSMTPTPGSDSSDGASVAPAHHP